MMEEQQTKNFAQEKELKEINPALNFEELRQKKYFPERRSSVRIKLSALFDPTVRVDIKYAETREELEKAYQIVHDSYVESGYMDPQPSGIRVSLFNALPHTLTMIVRAGSPKPEAPSYGPPSEIVATVSLILDSPLGLPMEEIYPEEIADLRKAGRKVAEVSALAAVKGARNHYIAMYANKLMIAYAQYSGVDDLCIAVNPKHAEFYEQILLFDSLGGQRSYSKVKDAPALAKRMDMNTIEDRARAVYDTGEFDANLYTFFFTQDMERSLLPGKKPWERAIMTPELLRYFFVEKTSLFKETPPEILTHIQACYPFYDFRQILGNGGMGSRNG